jgi:hypothetical protein
MKRNIRLSTVMVIVKKAVPVKVKDLNKCLDKVSNIIAKEMTTNRNKINTIIGHVNTHEDRLYASDRFRMNVEEVLDSLVDLTIETAIRSNRTKFKRREVRNL